jgi:hypothetical protein
MRSTAIYADSGRGPASRIFGTHGSGSCPNPAGCMEPSLLPRNRR